MCFHPLHILESLFKQGWKHRKYPQNEGWRTEGEKTGCATRLKGTLALPPYMDLTKGSGSVDVKLEGNCDPNPTPCVQLCCHTESSVCRMRYWRKGRDSLTLVREQTSPALPHLSHLNKLPEPMSSFPRGSLTTLPAPRCGCGSHRTSWWAPPSSGQEKPG